VDGSDVGFRMDFSCHRAVDLSFLRRLYRAHDRRGWSFYVHGAASPRQRRDKSASPGLEELREQVKKQAAAR